MSGARALTLAQRKRTLAVSLGLVLAGAFLYAGSVSVPARLVQHPSDSLGSPMLVVTVPPGFHARGENGTRSASAPDGVDGDRMDERQGG